jgi:cytochrome c biogenesis protein CcdA
LIINLLEQHLVARYEVSVQGTPEQINEQFGAEYVRPEIIQKSKHPPTKEPFLADDFGFVVGFLFATPCIIGAFIGFLFMDLRQLEQNELTYILGGAFIGAVIGMILATVAQKRRNKRIQEQEKKGGYVLWVTTTSEKKAKEIVKILKKHHAKSICIS